MRVSIALVLTGTLFASAAGRLTAQTPPLQEPLPSFEVASIRRSAGDLSGRVNSSTILTNTPGRLIITNMTVRGIIRNAFGFFIPKRDDVVGGPAWIDDDRWDVQATVEGDQSQTSPPDSRLCGGRGGPGRIMGTGMTAARLASLLESSRGRPVADQTGLIGRFDVDLTWSTELSIFTALKEQLGLRLEGGSTVVQDSIVIDRIERPSEN